MEVIISADDYGLSDLTCQGILEAHKNGILTSTSVMSAGALLSKQQIGWLMDCPKLGTGGHLSLTVGRPLNERLASFSQIVDEHGFFKPSYINLVQTLTFGQDRKHILKEIESELNLQLTRLLDSGLKIDHLNSQHHVHMFPPIFLIVNNLAEKYNIRHVRRSRERLSHFINHPHLLFEVDSINILKALILNIFSMALHPKVPSTMFYGVVNSGLSNWTYIEKMISSLEKNCPTEILFHPGKVEFSEDRVLANFLKFLASPAREEEIQLLCSNTFKNHLNKVGAKLCRFQDIAL